MGGVRRMLAAAAVCAAAACSLLVDTSGLSGDADAGADALAPPNPAPPPPPPPPPADAGSDAPRACETTFCDDFDEGAIGARWTTLNVDNGGMLTLDEAGVSPPFALGMHLPLRDGGPTRSAQLVKKLGPFPKTLVCTTELYVQTAVDTGEGYGLFIVRPSPNGGPWSLELKIRPTNTLQVQEGYDLPDGASTAHGTNVSTVPVGSWVSLSIAIAWPTQATVKIGSSAPLAIPFVAGQASTDDGGATEVAIGLGEDSDKDLPAFDALYDDFACTLTP